MTAQGIFDAELAKRSFPSYALPTLFALAGNAQYRLENLPRAVDLLERSVKSAELHAQSKYTAYFVSWQAVVADHAFRTLKSLHALPLRVEVGHPPSHEIAPEHALLIKRIDDALENFERVANIQSNPRALRVAAMRNALRCLSRLGMGSQLVAKIEKIRTSGLSNVHIGIEALASLFLSGQGGPADDFSFARSLPAVQSLIDQSKVTTLHIPANVTAYSGIVTGDSGRVTADSGISCHDGPEYAI